VARLDPYLGRRVIWWITLAVLGLSAALAVLVVLLGTAEGWQLIAHIAVSAAAAGLMVAASKLVDIPKARYTGLFAMAAVLVGLCMLLTAIWSQSGFWGELSFGFVATAVPAAAYIQALQHQGGRRGGIVALTAATAGLASWLVASWLENRGHFYKDAEKYNEWAAELWLLAVVLAVCLIGSGIDKRHWRWLGVGAAVWAFVLAALATLSEQQHDFTGLVILSSIAIVVTHANLMLLWRLPKQLEWFRLGTIGLMVLTMGWFAYVEIYQTFWPLGGAGRICIALGICSVSASVAVVVLSRFGLRGEPVAATLEFNQITIVCPHCKRKQTVGVGQAACGECGLRFTIEVHEPRCPNCSYLLLMIRSDRCPECGTPIQTPIAGVRPAV